MRNMSRSEDQGCIKFTDAMTFGEELIRGLSDLEVIKQNEYHRVVENLNGRCEKEIFVYFVESDDYNVS